MQEFVNDDPANQCFGCSPHNESGMKLRFRELESGVVESHHVVDAHLAGAPGVVHGGVQAVLLDEVMGVAIHRVEGNAEIDVVTAEFKLRYRRPVPTGSPLILRGSFQRRDGRDFWVEGAIMDASGERLTVAEARWRMIGTRVR